LTLLSNSCVAVCIGVRPGSFLTVNAISTGASISRADRAADVDLGGWPLTIVLIWPPLGKSPHASTP
jgi:hypothetical protein